MNFGSFPNSLNRERYRILGNFSVCTKTTIQQNRPFSKAINLLFKWIQFQPTNAITVMYEEADSKTFQGIPSQFSILSACSLPPPSRFLALTSCSLVVPVS